jgi:hypothetical protein
LADDFNPEALLQALDRHGVTFVLIGGYAAQLHGARRPTVDLDVTPERTSENLGRLAAALQDIGARIRVDGLVDGLPFSADAASLSGMEILNLTTRHGDLDIALTPAGTRGFTDLAEHAVRSMIARSRDLGCEPGRYHPVQGGREPSQGHRRPTRAGSSRQHRFRYPAARDLA